MAEAAAEPEALESKLNMSLDELIRQDPDLGGRGASSSGRNAGPGGRAAPKTVLVHAPRGRGGDAPRGRGRGWGRHGGFHDRGPQRLVHMHGGPPAGGMLRADPALFVPAGPFLVQGFGSPLAGMPGAMERGFGPAFNGGFGMMGGGYGDFMGPPEPQAVPPPRPPVLRCFTEAETRDVVVVYQNTHIIKVAPSGDISLDSGGFHGPALFKALNDTLSVVGVRVTTSGPDKWSVSDGRTLKRFEDGMVLKAAPAAPERGRLVKDHVLHPVGAAAAAATAASNAAAAAVGLLPAAGGPAAAGYGPAAMPPFGGRGPGRGRGRGFGGWGPGGRGPVLNGRGFPPGHRLPGGPLEADGSGGFGKDADHIRRLKAQGRYVPY